MYMLHIYGSYYLYNLIKFSQHFFDIGIIIMMMMMIVL